MLIYSNNNSKTKMTTTITTTAIYISPQQIELSTYFLNYCLFWHLAEITTSIYHLDLTLHLFAVAFQWSLVPPWRCCWHPTWASLSARPTARLDPWYLWAGYDRERRSTGHSLAPLSWPGGWPYRPRWVCLRPSWPSCSLRIKYQFMICLEPKGCCTTHRLQPT